MLSPQPVSNPARVHHERHETASHSRPALALPTSSSAASSSPAQTMRRSSEVEARSSVSSLHFLRLHPNRESKLEKADRAFVVPARISCAHRSNLAYRARRQRQLPVRLDSPSGRHPYLIVQGCSQPSQPSPAIGNLCHCDMSALRCISQRLHIV